ALNLFRLQSQGGQWPGNAAGDQKASQNPNPQSQDHKRNKEEQNLSRAVHKLMLRHDRPHPPMKVMIPGELNLAGEMTDALASKSKLLSGFGRKTGFGSPEESR